MAQVTPGRRLPADTEIHLLKPGDYIWDGGPTLWGCVPDGTEHGQLCRVDERWGIEQHEDGSVSVVPCAPGEMHSIWINKPTGWHGYLERGVWREA